MPISTLSVIEADIANGLIGDVNQDGLVDVADIAILIRIIAEQTRYQESLGGKKFHPRLHSFGAGGRFLLRKKVSQALWKVKPYM